MRGSGAAADSASSRSVPLEAQRRGNRKHLQGQRRRTDSDVAPATPEHRPVPMGVQLSSSPPGIIDSRFAFGSSGGSRASDEAWPSGNLDSFNQILDSIEAYLNLPENNCEEQLPWVLGMLKGKVQRFAMDPRGCRVLQRVLELAADEEQADIASELRGHVCEALESPHGNHVLQRCVELMRPSGVAFILRELFADRKPSSIARHRFGCRLMERLIEHFPPEQLAECISDILHDAPELCKHVYGNFVMQHVLEHGDQGQRMLVIKALRQDLDRIAIDPHACSVLDKALSYGVLADQRELARAILKHENLLADMAAQRGGFAATQRLFKVADQEMLLDAKRQLQVKAHDIQRSKHGKALLQALLKDEVREGPPHNTEGERTGGGGTFGRAGHTVHASAFVP